MPCIQREIVLPHFPRGFHLITNRILEEIPELDDIDRGLLHIFIKHTSASLTINENADPTVRDDFRVHFDKLMPEDMSYYTHDYEGSDDMPAHLKSSTLGCSVSIPVTSGRLNLGVWQGIYFGEHRNRGGSRKLVLTLFGS